MSEFIVALLTGGVAVAKRTTTASTFWSFAAGRAIDRAVFRETEWDLGVSRSGSWQVIGDFGFWAEFSLARLAVEFLMA
jgi:hypothetical protein